MPKKRVNTFWQSFFLGTVIGTTALYFLGTKKGRSQLRDFLSLLDDHDLEEKIHKILSDNNLEKTSQTSINKIIQSLTNKF